jgi:hypothetical protein
MTFMHPPQVISILHHHLNRHHINNMYVPTDFFETSAMVISLILLGKYLESTAKVRRVKNKLSFTLSHCHTVTFPLPHSSAQHDHSHGLGHVMQLDAA